MLLLDTNVISELRKTKAGRADPAVVEWAHGLRNEPTFVSVITLHELELGVLRAERRDQRAGAILRNWLHNDVSAAFGPRVLPVDADIAIAAAALHVPDPAPFADALIAATGLTRDLAVVTRNVGDFERFTGLEVVNPWSTTER